MKLYTEEQVIQMYNQGWSDAQYRMELHLELLTPIELPSDDEIEECSLKEYYYDDKREGFVQGAKRLKEQILNQNK